MRFHDLTTAATATDMADAVAAEQHWRGQFAAVLRSAEVRALVTGFVRTLIPKPLRFFVPYRRIVEQVMEKLARWVAPGAEGLRDILATEEPHA